jgi:hypothetical protein
MATVQAVEVVLAHRKFSTSMRSPAGFVGSPMQDRTTLCSRSWSIPQLWISLNASIAWMPFSLS